MNETAQLTSAEVLSGFCDKHLPDAEVVFARDKTVPAKVDLAIDVPPGVECPLLVVLDRAIGHVVVFEDIETFRGCFERRWSELLQVSWSHQPRKVAVIGVCRSRENLGPLIERLNQNTFVWVAAEPNHMIEFGSCKVQAQFIAWT